MLHVTNGESVELGHSALGGEVLVWRDVLHEGPVPAGLSLEEMSAARAAFIHEEYGEDESACRRTFRQRDETLARFRDHEEVVLWFEHDLFDQLQLIQVLDWFSRENLDDTQLSLICVASYLGRLRSQELADLFPARREVTDAQLQLARRAWHTFSSSAPTGLVQLLREDTAALPFLQGALFRHLEQFPAVSNGLSRSERQILEIVASGISRGVEVFQADAAREERIFMGDITFLNYLRALVNARVPLLRFTEPGGRIYTAKVEITPEGRAVLESNADHVRLNGIDRWRGGVHLREGNVWRWEGTSRKMLAEDGSPLCS
jgi:hypothetical protein